MDNTNHNVNATKFQEQLAKKVITEDDFDRKGKFVCGVDVSYKKNIAQCSVVIVKNNSLEVVEVVQQAKVRYRPLTFLDCSC